MSLIAVCVLLIAVTTFAQISARTITVTPNPSCGNCTETDLRLLQIDSNGASDHIVYLLSSFGPPTLLIAHFNERPTVDVKWPCLENGSSDCVKFNPLPTFASTFVLNRIIEYDDDNDTVDVTKFSDKPNFVRSTYLAAVKWQPISTKHAIEPAWKFYLNESNDEHYLISKNESNASFSIDFSFFDKQARTSIMPGILHSDSAGMFDVRMCGLATHFNSSRFALEIVVVGDSLPGTSDFTTFSSVDDEYSPGVFQVATWMMNGEASAASPSTYLHYKPVSYTKEERNLESIQPVHISKIRFFNYDDLKATSGGLTYAYFGDNIRLRNVQSANFSVGSAKDGGFNYITGYNYTTFTAVFGVGQPALDSMSAQVIVAISVGIGVPAVLIIFSAIVAIYRIVKNGSEPNRMHILVNDSVFTR